MELKCLPPIPSPCFNSCLWLDYLWCPYIVIAANTLVTSSVIQFMSFVMYKRSDLMFCTIPASPVKTTWRGGCSHELPNSFGIELVKHRGESSPWWVGKSILYLLFYQLNYKKSDDTSSTMSACGSYPSMDRLFLIGSCRGGSMQLPTTGGFPGGGSCGTALRPRGGLLHAPLSASNSLHMFFFESEQLPSQNVDYQ